MVKKKILKLLIGTNNTGKLKEIRNLLPKNISTFSPQDFRIKSPKENGQSFKENSLIKAKYFSKKTNLVCLSDDSGLEIEVLHGAPGIYSARWGGKNGDFKKAIKKVYREINKKDNKWKTKKIKARFICALSLCYLEKKILSVEGKVEGKISLTPKGNNGFGYDPIFISNKEKLTFGQMKPAKKYLLDHRSKAFKKIKKFF
jgi:XTP/dITP diphosphohydrolase